MAERQDPHYEETEHPRNPPNAVLNPRARNQAFWSYLGPIIALFAIIAVALTYWLGRSPGRDNDPDTLRPEIGTTGEQLQNDDPARDLDQGGFEPQGRPDSTQDELNRRGAESPGAQR